MNVVIIGWYGTETIGDRAILAGIINLLSEISPQFNLSLGSLIPDFSKRTLIEDTDFYNEISQNNLRGISLFDSLNRNELKKAINNSDLVIVGGGPLMDIDQMFMLEYAFRYAKRRGRKTAIVGCGWGPLKSKEHIKAAASIIHNSNLTIFRDATSLNEYLKCDIRKLVDSENITSSIDPAFFCADYYRRFDLNNRKKDYIAINFRDISKDQYGGDSDRNDKLFSYIIDSIRKQYDMPVHLVPMHSYFVGGDDRSQFNRIAFSLDDASGIIVHNNPPSLVEVMSLYKNAQFCVGMRFHSIVLQTILNGRNIILDYTDPSKGKIISMMRELYMLEAYKDKYLSLINIKELQSSLTKPEQFIIKEGLLQQYKKIYINRISSLLGNG